MKFKNFSEYLNEKDGDIKSYLNKVAIATSRDVCPIFKKVDSDEDIVELSEKMAVIISDDFAYRDSSVNESSVAYNSAKSDLTDLRSKMGDCENLPNQVNDIQDIKKLKFPVIATNKEGSDRFKTIGKLKAAEKIYNTFKEDIVPKTRFKVLVFKDVIIGIQELINKLPLDVDINKFKDLGQLSSIAEKVNDAYSLDFYNIEVLESNKGKFYIKSVDQDINPNPLESVSLYEKAYLEYNKRPLPNWVKSKLKSEYVKPYCKSKYYDSMLVKSNNTMDYSKYLDK